VPKANVRPSTLYNVLLFCIIASLASCTSIPFSTLVRFSTFSEQDFAAVNPDDVRVKISVPAGFEVSVSKSLLKLSIKSVEEAFAREFDMDQLERSESTRSVGAFSSKKEVITYVLRLSQRSKSDFKELQKFVQSREKYAVNIDVYSPLLEAPCDSADVTFWVDILLSPRQGYVTLFDGAQMKISRTKEHPLCDSRSATGVQ
jgi:hypothetical protein